MTYAPEAANRRRSQTSSGQQLASRQAAFSQAPLLARLILTVALVGWVGSTGAASLTSEPGNARTESRSAQRSVEGQGPELVEGRLSELPIGMMVHPPALDYFNTIARSDDIGAALVVSTGLLPRITGGQRLVMSPSVELAEERAAEFVDETEFFGYNIEHWPDTPTSEQRSPGEASAAAAEFARRHGLRYVIGPDLQFTEDFGAELAAPAEIYVIQGQRIQEDIPFFTTTVTNFAQNVRLSSPTVSVWVQVSASFGTPEQTLAALQAIADRIDGIWIHYNQNAQSFAALQRLVTLLRGAAPVPESDATRTVVLGQAPAAEPTTATPTAAFRQPTTIAQAPAVFPSATPTTLPDSSPRTPAAGPVLPPSTAVPIPYPSTQSPAAPWLPIAGAAIVVLAAGLIAIGFVAGSIWQRRP